jgi:pyruvate dehydrogenase E1 component
MSNSAHEAKGRERAAAMKSVPASEETEAAHGGLDELLPADRRRGAPTPYSVNTTYLNTIQAERQPTYPGDLDLEERIRSTVRWNTLAMVQRANQDSNELSGHIASFQSAATLFEVGYLHFWRGPADGPRGDLVFIQGHSAPGIYGYAYLQGRLTEQHLLNFRQEVDGNGLSSYPHPRLMPHFWQFSTVSMGLGPVMASYQARFLKYLDLRGIASTAGRKVWGFLGDGETDEPESLAAIALAGRERLDNLIFVVNCNLQRIDGPVRGNGKIIQDLEAVFGAAGWNVVKVIWGGGWDPLLARDTSGLLLQRMEECVDGEYQNLRSKNGAYFRRHFFGKYPELLELVAGMSDAELWDLAFGGHDPAKVHAAYAAAAAHTGQPTVILAKTVKGWGMGDAGESQNTAHLQKTMDREDLRAFRDRFAVPVTDEQLEDLPFLSLESDAPEAAYLQEHRTALGGHLPARRTRSTPLEVPALSVFEPQLNGTTEEISTTTAFVQVVTTLLRDQGIGDRVVPIVSDESRAFGMEAMYPEFGIFSQVGQRYRPEDADEPAYYREAMTGQMLQEGISEAGAMSSWIAAGTSYSVSDTPMIPFYIFYSMFGFQRTLDLAWAAGDMRARGFLLGATAGRTTLNGEGLQHSDGHSHLLASVIPCCMSYDPAFAYEVAVIVQEGLRRMCTDQEDIFYYLTLTNENYPQLALPKGAERGIVKGMYLLREGRAAVDLPADAPRVQLLGSGTILREVLAAADLLAADYGVMADVWSAPSFTELRRDGLAVERWNLLNPAAPPRVSYVEQCLADHPGPVVAATDYMKSFADQIRPFVPRRYSVLGTDGFGRSDHRSKLRFFFEVDRHFVVIAALGALARDGVVPVTAAAEALERYGIDPGKPDPVLS